MQRLMNYPYAFEEDFSDPFVEARVVDIVDGIMSSNCLITTPMATQGHHICLKTLILRIPKVIHSLRTLTKSRDISMTLEISDLDDPALFISDG